MNRVEKKLMDLKQTQVSNIRDQVNTLVKICDRWQKKLDKAKESGKMRCSNFDQREYDAMCSALRKTHIKICHELEESSVYEAMDIVYKALEKIDNDMGGGGYL